MMRTLVFVLCLATLAACRQPDDVSPPSGEIPTEAFSTGTPAAETTPDTPIPPQMADDDTLTVVFFGDSLTAGFGLPDPEGQSYPGLIADRLAEAGIEARVVNAGNSGETTAGGLRRVDWILGRMRPDVFVLALGGNDMLRGIPLSDTEANLSGIFEKVRESAPDARLVLAGMEAVANLGEDYRNDFREVFPEVAARYDAALIPFLLEGVGGIARLNQPDGIHPTTEGQRLIAATVWETLVPLVQSAS